MYGKKHSEVTKKIISDKNKGKIPINKGVIASTEFKKLVSENTKKAMTKEICEWISYRKRLNFLNKLCFYDKVKNAEIYKKIFSMAINRKFS